MTDKTKLGLPTATKATQPETVPDIARALPWRSWRAGGDEALQRQVPMLVFAEPRWANSAQRLALILETDERLRAALSDRVVPVLVDPTERPDLAAYWRWAAVTFTGTSGPPLIVLLTHEGLPFLSYGNMQFEGDDLTPSLASLILGTADAYAEDMNSFTSEATGIDNVSLHQVENYQAFSTWWHEMAPEIDAIHGGGRQLPKHPHPQVLWSVMSQSEPAHDAAAWVRTTLKRMKDGGIYDQLDRGFHRCTRDDRWIVPHFEKPLPLNAQLAAVYARAASEQNDNAFLTIARDLARFCLSALKEDVDCVASNSAYYTWTSEELRSDLDGAYVQPTSLHFGIVPSPLRQVLHCAIPIEGLEQYSREDVTVLGDRVERGRKQMLGARQQRPSPTLITVPGFSWRAETLRWLFIAAAWLPPRTLDLLEASLESLIAARMNPRMGYVRDNTESVAWLEDQASLLGAMVAAYRSTKNEIWITRAVELSDIVIRAYRVEDGWSDRAEGRVASRGLVDDILPSTIGTLTDSLHALNTTGNDYGEVAMAQAAFYLNAASTIGLRSASFWRAWWKNNFASIN